MTGYTSKKAAANAKLEQAKEILLQSPQKDIEWQREQQIKAHAKLNDDDDDDDIQVYQREWVGLTDDEKNGRRVLENGLLFNAAEVQAWELGVEYAEAKLKEKNT